MKQCPECRLIYTDEALNYCLDDGTTLIQIPAAGDARTAILSGDPPSEAPTRHISSPIEARPFPAHPDYISKRKRFVWLLSGLACIVIVVALGYVYYGSAKTKQVESIAVMPFANATSDPDLEYLSDGITESLINALSQLPTLSVKGRSSVFRYKGKDVEPQQVGTDLTVQAVLNGRVLQRGENLTISLDLVDSATGNQIWGDKYTRKVGDLAALQTEISRDVAEKLRTKLTRADEDRVVRNQTKNSEAYQLYLQGRYYWNKRTGQSAKKAIEFFQQAIEKDPNYAMAYVGLAETYPVSDLTIAEGEAKSRAAADKALELDPTLGEPHISLANYANAFERNYTAAEAEYKRGIELAPNYATAYHWYAGFLTGHGRFEEGFAQYKKALELDPLSLAIGTDYGMDLAYARKFDEAIEYLKKLEEADPTYVRTHSYLSRVFVWNGQYEEAIREHEKAKVLNGADPTTETRQSEQLLAAFKSNGPKGFWNKVLEFNQQDLKAGKPVSELGLADSYAHLEDRDRAFEHLNKAIDQLENGIQLIPVSPQWDNLRGDSRFNELLRRMNFTP